MRADLRNNISPSELKTGIQTELEHTNNIRIAKKIAMDHLKEDPNYYSKLSKVGLSHNNHSATDTTTVPSEQPLHNKTITLDIAENKSKKKKKKKKKKPVPTNPKKWAAAKAWARRTFDVYPSAYANAAAAKRYKKNGGGWRMSENILNDEYDFTDTPSTYLNGYDKIGESIEFQSNKNTSIMKINNISELKKTIKRLVKEELENNSSDNGDEMNVTQPEEMDQADSQEQDGEQITLTLDKDVAQKMHDILMAALEKTSESDEDESSDETEDSSDAQDSEEMPLKESKVIKLAKQLVKNRR